jgi:hypothetical protein
LIDSNQRRSWRKGLRSWNSKGLRKKSLLSESLNQRMKRNLKDTRSLSQRTKNLRGKSWNLTSKKLRMWNLNLMGKKLRSWNLTSKNSNQWAVNDGAVYPNGEHLSRRMRGKKSLTRMSCWRESLRSNHSSNLRRVDCKKIQNLRSWSWKKGLRNLKYKRKKRA